MPSARRFAVRSRTAPFATTWSGVVGAVSHATSWRTANVFAARFESRARRSGCASFSVAFTPDCTIFARSARIVVFFGKAWKRRDVSREPERASGKRNFSNGLNVVPSSEISRAISASALHAHP